MGWLAKAAVCQSSPSMRRSSRAPLRRCRRRLLRRRLGVRRLAHLAHLGLRVGVEGHELVKLDDAVVVLVNRAQRRLGLGRIELAARVRAEPLELKLIEAEVAVRVVPAPGCNSLLPSTSEQHLRAP